MIQEKKPWTDADELGLGLNLAQEIRAHHRRGEAPPRELEEALAGWQEQAAKMAYSVPPGQRNPWYELNQDIEAAMLDMSGMRQSLEFEAAVHDRPPPALARAVQGLSRMRPTGEEGEPFAPFDVLRITHDEADTEGYYVPPEIGSREFALSPEALRTGSILHGDLDGTTVTDSEGETWDLAPHLAELARPEVRAMLAQSLQDVMPDPNGVVANALGALPAMQLGVEGINKAMRLLGVEDQDIRNVDTAYPGLRLPWLVPLGEDGTYRGDETDLAHDPLFARALWETIGEMQSSGELKPGFLETFLRGAGGLADFMVFSKGLGLAAKGVGKAALAARVPEASVPGMLATKLAKGAGGTVFPLNTSIGHTVANMAVYQAIGQSTNPDTTLVENIKGGAGQGFLFSFAGGLMGIARTAATAAVKAFPPTRELAKRVTGRLWGASPMAARNTEAVIGRMLEFPERSFSKTFGKLEIAPYTKIALQKSLDAFGIGMFVHAFNEAQAEGTGYKGFWRGLANPNAVANGLSFAMDGILQHAATSRGQMQKLLASPGTQAFLKHLAQDMAQPRRGSDVRAIFEQLKAWKAEEPDLWKGVEWRPPKVQKAAEQDAADLARPPALPKGTKKVEPPPEWAVGEIPADDLRSLGFEAKTDAGVYKHALNAVHEYLREVEGGEQRFTRFADVPRPLLEQALHWRDTEKNARRGPEFELPETGETYTPPRVRRSASQLTLGEAERLIPKVEAEPAYRGLDPVEQAVKAKQRETKRRPALGRAVELANAGKASPEQMREWFPEADRSKFKTTTEWEAAVRAVWKQRKTANLRRATKERVDEANTLQNFVRKMGGIRWVSDLETLSNREGGRGIVHSKKSGKGMPLDDMAEAATEMGFFAERPTEAEMIDALVENIRPPDFQGLRAHREHEEDQARMEHDMRLLWREEIESGRAPMPPTKAEQTLDAWLRRAEREAAAESVADDLIEMEEAGQAPKPWDLAAPFFAPGGAYDSMSEKGRKAFARSVERVTGAKEGDVEWVKPETGEEGRYASVEQIVRGFVEDAGSFAEMKSDYRRLFGLLLEIGEAQRQHEAGTNPFTRKQATLAEIYAGDERFEGQSPERIERQVLELRAQAGVGDPGPVLAGPPETSGDYAYRASVGTRRLVEELKAAGLLDIDAPIHSVEAMDAIMRAASGEAPPDLVARARAVREATRAAWDAILVERASEQDRQLVSDTYAAIDAQIEGRDMPADVRERFAKLNVLDEVGRLKTAFVDAMQREAADALNEMDRLAREGGAEDVFGSILTPLGFFGRTYTSVEENRIGRLLTWQFYADNPRIQEWYGRSRFAQRVAKTLGFALSTPLFPIINLGPISKPQTTASRTRFERFAQRAGQEQGKRREREMAMSFILSEMYAQWGGRRPSRAHLEFFDYGVESGVFKNSNGPADLEKIRPGTGYMWKVYEGTRDLLDEMGRDLVRVGLLTQEQLDTLGGGAYAHHQYVSEQLLHDAEELGQGNMPIKGIGLSMQRSDGISAPEAPRFRIKDALVTYPAYVRNAGMLVQIFNTLRYVQSKRFAFTAEQVARMNPLDRMQFQRAAVRTTPSHGRSLVEEIGAQAKGRKDPPEAVVLGARLQLLAAKMAPPGEDPGPGQIRYSKALADTIDFFFGDTFIPADIAKEIDIQMSEMFALPGSDGWAKGGRFFDLVNSFRKRSLVVLRPAAWALQVASNVELNHGLGGVSRWDFMRGAMGLPSFTGDAMRGGFHYFRWLKEGMPTARPEGWTESDWSDAMAASLFLDQAGPSSSIFATLSPEVAHAYGAALETRGSVQDSLMAQADAAAKRGNWTVSQRDRIRLAVEEFSGRVQRGLEAVDEKIAAAMGAADPAEQAQGIAMWASAWHLMDLFVFKYPAYLKAKHEFPNSPPSRQLSYALGLTSDMRDTSAWQRRYLSMTTPWNDKLWRAATPHSWIKLVTAQAFRGRFWSFPATMTSKIARGIVRHPLRMGSSALVLSGIAAGINSLLSDDERRQWEEEESIARDSLTNPILFNQAQEAAAKEILGKIRAGSPFLGTELAFPPSAVEAMSSFWKRLRSKDPMHFRAPEHGGEARIGSLAEATPAGYLINRARGVGKIASGLANLGKDPDAAGRVVTGVERLFGLQAQAAAGMAMGWFTGGNPIIQAMGGKGTVGESFFKTMNDIARSSIGFGYPTLGLLSPEGVYLGESLLLDGQSFQEYFAGIVSQRRPDAAQELAGAAARIVWPSRSVYQKPSLAAPIDPLDSILLELYGPGFSVRKRGVQWARQQIRELIPDLYETHFQDAAEPGKASVTLDERVAGAFAEFDQATSEIAPGRWAVTAEAPKTALVNAVAQLPQPDQSHAIDYIRKWYTSPSFKEGGLNMLLEAGRRLEMGRGLFREAFFRAMDDPGGANLIKWWDAQIAGGDLDTLGQLAPLLSDIETPAEGSEAFDAWARIYAAYNARGVGTPPIPETVEKRVEAILGGKGAARMLQGGRALKNVLQERAPNEAALDALFTPR